MSESKIEYCRCCKLPKSKICNKCKEEKTSNNFYPGKKVCKQCKSQYNKNRYISSKVNNKSNEILLEKNNT